MTYDEEKALIEQGDDRVSAVHAWSSACERAEQLRQALVKADERAKVAESRADAFQDVAKQSDASYAGLSAELDNMQDKLIEANRVCAEYRDRIAEAQRALNGDY